MVKSLATLLAVPLIALAGCGDPVRFPYSGVVNANVDGAKISHYTNMFETGYSGLEILNVKYPTGDKMTFIGNCDNKRVDGVEFGGFFGEKRRFGSLPKGEQDILYGQFCSYCNELEKGRVKTNDDNF
jgi:predicted small lipoprotein YifL